MREILFREKRESDGKWVYGYLAEIETAWDRYEYGSLPTEYQKVIVRTDLLIREAVEIFPETVGQYTGLTDKSGKKIFEGDIVLVNDDDTEKGCVVWDNTELEYGIDIGSVRLKMGCFYSREIEVIGNIYDDPGLLKGSTE